jgi:hypothetical protein
MQILKFASEFRDACATRQNEARRAPWDVGHNRERMARFVRAAETGVCGASALTRIVSPDRQVEFDRSSSSMAHNQADPGRLEAAQVVKEFVEQDIQ